MNDLLDFEKFKVSFVFKVSEGPLNYQAAVTRGSQRSMAYMQSTRNGLQVRILIEKEILRSLP